MTRVISRRVHEEPPPFTHTWRPRIFVPPVYSLPCLPSIVQKELRLTSEVPWTPEGKGGRNPISLSQRR